MNPRFLENLKTTIERIDRYMLLGCSSAIVFCAYSLPNARHTVPGDIVNWQLLGFSLQFAPSFALVALYLLYCFSCLMMDNMLLHVRDLARALRREAGSNVVAQARVKSEIAATLSHPTAVTVSPIGQIACTIVPALLIVCGLVTSASSGSYRFPPLYWVPVGAIVVVLGAWNCFRVQQCLRPHLLVGEKKEERRASKPAQTTPNNASH